MCAVYSHLTILFCRQCGASDAAKCNKLFCFSPELRRSPRNQLLIYLLYIEQYVSVLIVLINNYPNPIEMVWVNIRNYTIRGCALCSVNDAYKTKWAYMKTKRISCENQWFSKEMSRLVFIIWFIFINNIQWRTIYELLLFTIL